MANVITGLVNSCTCTMGGPCHCCTPRKPAPRQRRKTESALSAVTTVTPVISAHTPAASAIAVDPNEEPASHASSHIIARISELRPVLPRPTAHHDPSLGVAHGHHSRHHENAFFSPYGRAYDINHPHHSNTADDIPRFSSDPVPPKPQTYDRAMANSIPVAPNVSSTSVTFPSPCGCGDGCSCPGCFHHNDAPFTPSPTAYPTCSNPASCQTCLDCTILSLPADTALSIPVAQQAEAIDEWIRRVQANPDSMMMSPSSVDDQTAGWVDGLAQSTAVRRQCTTCTSFYTCEKEGSDHSNPPNEASCCSKPKTTDMSSMMSVPGNSQEQAGYGSPDYFDYSSMLGNIQPSDETYFDATTSVMEPLRSRSPSVPLNSTHDLPSQLFTSFPYSTLIDKMPPSQHSMYINGRGFYSDPYLSLSSSERMEGFVLDTQTPFLALPLSNADYTPRTYAASNPDSDTSSFDSLDDFAPPPPPPQSKQSVSPISFEGVRTLY